MIISKTPYRVSFFGGGTDYACWYRENQGQVLTTTIDKYCYITCRVLPPFFKHKHRIVYSTIEDVTDIAKIQHPSVRACMQFMNIKEGLEIHHDGDLPARSGLGSSSAFTVGLLNALYALKGKMVSPEQLTADAIYVEQEALKENVGAQDQVIAAHGGCNIVTFGHQNHLQVRPLTLPSSRITELQEHLMLFYTGVQRIASDIAGAQIKNTPARKKDLTVMCAMVDQAVEILNSRTDISEFGRLMHENWKIKRNLTDKITNPVLDEMYSAALKSGALGGKILGAGGGGFMLIFADPKKQSGIRTSLKNLLHVPFKFDYSGSSIIFCRQ